MSTSTIILKNPPPGYQANIVKGAIQEHKSSLLLITSLWLFSCIFSAARVDFSSNVTGISIAFNMQDVVLIAFTAWMLNRGLSTRNIMLIFPWVAITLYGLYYNHYKSLARMMGILRHVRHATVLPWMALLITSVGLILRVILILRILQLSANLWYRKKLEKELYETIN